MDHPDGNVSNHRMYGSGGHHASSYVPSTLCSAVHYTPLFLPSPPRPSARRLLRLHQRHLELCFSPSLEVPLLPLCLQFFAAPPPIQQQDLPSHTVLPLHRPIPGHRCLPQFLAWHPRHPLQDFCPSHFHRDRRDILFNIFFAKKNAISLFFDGSGNKSIGATMCIGQEIQCLPYAGFLVLNLSLVLFFIFFFLY